MVVERTKSAPQIALIQMPFAVTAWPSLGLSLLRSGLGKRGISSTVYYLNLEFLKMVGHEIYQDLALGAPANTNSSGADVGEQGTYPFGESWYNNNTTSNWVYTSYERDAESGDDYALARSYANTNGRFLSPDPLEGIVGDPQSWNRYAYVENDPINLTDPSGQGFWSDLGSDIANLFEDIGAAFGSMLDDGGQQQNSNPCPGNVCVLVWPPSGGGGGNSGGSPGGTGAGPGSPGGPTSGDPAADTGSCPGGGPCAGGTNPGQTGAAGQGPGGQGVGAPGSWGAGGDGPVYQQPNASNPTEVLLTNIVYNETSSLRGKGSGAGSAANLHNARVAIAEIALRLGLPQPPIVAPSWLSASQVAAINAGYPPAINAHNDSLAAARQAMAGSNISNGATQYRPRSNANMTTNIGADPAKGLVGTKVSMSFGPFPRAGGVGVVVIAP